MKLSSPSISVLFALGITYRLALADTSQSATVQGRLVDKCCQVGRERAIESPKFNCKLSARDALIGSSPSAGSPRNHLALTAESLLARDPTFADQCEMVLESCCMAHHRTRNCDSGKQFAKSGATCMDVELSKEATVATESFNDCCMSCSLGILAARTPAQNESSQATNRRDRCKLIQPLASSLSGQLYEQTYDECCQENLPKISSAILQPGSQIDCAAYNPCSQRCVSSFSRRFEQDRCDCFNGYKLSSDGINCVDIDECKLNTHTCNRHSEICDNTQGSFRCLARQASLRSSSLQLDDVEPINDNGEPLSGFSPRRLCPFGQRWDSVEGRCQPANLDVGSFHRSASLVAAPNSRQLDDVQPYEFRSFDI